MSAQKTMARIAMPVPTENTLLRAPVGVEAVDVLLTAVNLILSTFATDDPLVSEATPTKASAAPALIASSTTLAAASSALVTLYWQAVKKTWKLESILLPEVGHLQLAL